MTKPRPQGDRTRDIPAHTGLRGLAALVVVVAHLKLELMYPVPFIEWASRFVSWKGQAVDLFFILSGFVLCHVYGFRSKIRWRSYGMARFARIYPLALATIVVLVALDAYSFLRHGIPSEQLSATRIALNIFLLNGLKDSWVPLGINPPSWSISVEAFLYIIAFPILTFLFIRLRQFRVPWSYWILAASILLLMGLYQYYKIIPILGEHTRLLRGVLGFTAGYAMRELCHKHEQQFTKKEPNKKFLNIIGPAAIGIGIITLAAEWPLIFLIPLLATIVYATYADHTPLSKGLSKPLFIYLGERSYSIYLIHHFAIEFTYRVTLYPKQLADGSYPLPARLQATLGVFAVTLILSELSLRFFENPMRDWIRRRLP